MFSRVVFLFLVSINWLIMIFLIIKNKVVHYDVGDVEPIGG